MVERTRPRRRKKRASSAARTVSVTTRGTVGRKYPSNSKHPGHEPPEHFHVNLAEIPFVTGKVTADFQLLCMYNFMTATCF